MADLSDIEEAFDELLEAKADNTPGGAEYVVIAGRKHEFLSPEAPTEEIIVGGGDTEGEILHVKCRRREFARLPRKGTKAKIRGRTLDIISAIERNKATVEFAIGSLLAE